MTDSNYTHVLCVVDRSGSMAGVDKDMRGGLDTFFAEQAKEDGKCLVDYVQFDSEYEKVFEDKDVANAKAVLQPRGSTALLDALGRSVTELGEKLAAKSEGERPGHVIVVVVTDGYENASHDWTREKVKELVERQQDEWNWVFTFLGANMDAVAEGASYGVKGGTSLTYSTASAGQTFSSLSQSVTRTRTGGDGSYTDAERAAAVGK